MLSSDQEAIQMATILFLHGWRSVPGGVKPTYLVPRMEEMGNGQEGQAQYRDPAQPSR
jgi:predicted esterase YcpF (UPF0227 family)